MTGFTADWLALREPADHKARSPVLLEALAEWCAKREALTVLDLGCGAGSNARALVPRLGAKQHWRLIDNDPALLKIAAERFPNRDESGGSVTAEIEPADISQGVDSLLAKPCDLVTAAALFDLVSKPWLVKFAETLCAHKLPLYAVLIYDGIMTFEPAHSADMAVRLAFNAHQQRDKGFGAAAGPQAGLQLAKALEQRGFTVMCEPSPWRLGPADRALSIANAEGIAIAASETGHVPDATLAEWLALRRRGGACTVGHVDLLAFPPG